MKIRALWTFILIVLLVACRSREAINSEASSNAQIELAKQFLQSEQYPAVLRLMLPLAKQGERPEVHSIMGLAYLGSGNLLPAQRAFETAVQLNAEDYDSQLNLGYVLLLQKKYELARAEFKKILKAGKYIYNERVYSNIGLSYLEEKKCQLGISAFGESLKLDPTFVQAYFNRGKCLMLLKKYRDAVSDFTRAVSFCPGCVEPKIELAHAQAEAGFKTQAVQKLQELLKSKLNSNDRGKTMGLLKRIQK